MMRTGSESFDSIDTNSGVGGLSESVEKVGIAISITAHTMERLDELRGAVHSALYQPDRQFGLTAAAKCVRVTYSGEDNFEAAVAMQGGDVVRYALRFDFDITRPQRTL